MTATLVVNADLGNYSPALGAAQMLPNGNLDFTSGLQGNLPNTRQSSGRQSKCTPNGTQTFVQQMTAMNIDPIC